MLRELTLSSSKDQTDLKYIVELSDKELQLREDQIVRMFLNRMDTSYTDKYTTAWSENSFIHKDTGQSEKYEFQLKSLGNSTLIKEIVKESIDSWGEI